MLPLVHDVLEGKGDCEDEKMAIAAAEGFSHLAPRFPFEYRRSDSTKWPRVGMAVQRLTHDRADEASLDPADGFPADATLSNQCGRCLNPSLLRVPASGREPLSEALGAFVGVVVVRRGGHGGSCGWRSSGRSFAKGEADVFVAPCGWQWS